MSEKGKTDLDSLFVSDSGETTRLKVLQAKAILEEVTEGTTMVHRLPIEVHHVSWARRLLNWFRRI